MHNVIRTAIISRLAEHFELPEDVRQRLDGGKNSQTEVLALIDAQCASRKDLAETARLKNFRAAVLGLNRGLQFPEDCAGMIANYESITGQQFSKPAWLSTEMKRVD